MRTITKTGGGFLTLSGTSTYTPGTNFLVSGGTWWRSDSITSSGAASGPLGSAPITLNNGGLVLAVTSTAAASTFNMSAGNPVTLNGTSDTILAGAGTRPPPLPAARSTWPAAVTIAPGQTLNLGTSNGYTMTFDPSLAFNNSGTVASERAMFPWRAAT